MITGHFTADFASFYDACTKAEVSLNGIQSGASKVEGRLDTMANSLNGTKIIQQATIAAEAVDRIGGISRLTEKELARVGATALEAANKLRAMGEDVPPKIQALADSVTNVEKASTRTGPAVGGMTSSLHAFDGVLAAAGIHIGPEIKAIGDLGEASGKTMGQLGTLATVGLTVGAAFGGWKIGRIIADFTGSDKIIGDAATKLLGWGDAAQIAGAKADVLALASARAHREITEMGEAARINKAFVDQLALVAGRSKDPLGDAAEAMSGWRHEIGRVRADGNIDALTRDLNSQNFSLEAISKRYGVTVEALGYFSRQMKDATADADKLAAAQKAQAEFQDHLFGRDLLAKAAEYARGLGDIHHATTLAPAAQAEMNKALAAAIEVLKRAGLGASTTANQYHDLLVATTDWAAVNAKIATLPDPFKMQNEARRSAFRDTQVAILDQTQGITDSQIAWRESGGVVEIVSSKMADDIKQVGPAAAGSAGQAKQEFVSAFQQIGNAADAAADRVARVLQLASDNAANMKGNPSMGANFGTASAINRIAASAAGLTIPQFAEGGPVTKDGPIFAHAGEYVVPKGGVGGGGVTIQANIVVNLGSGGDAKQAGRDVADALLARMQQRGARV